MSAVTIMLGHVGGYEPNRCHIMTHLNDATWQWDITRDIVDWSAAMYQIAGLDPETPLPPFREHGRFYTSDSWHRLVSAVLKVFTTGAPFRIELRMVRPDHAIQRITCSGGAVRDADDQIVRLRGLVEEIPEPPVLSFPGPLSCLTGSACPPPVDSLINAYESELARVSRQLREDICQRLALIAVEVQQLEAPTPDFATEQPIHVEGLWQRVDEALSQVYGLAEQLRPSVLELLGLREAVRGLCREYSNLWRIRAESTVTTPADIDRRLALIFFRICQAALRDVEMAGSPRDMAIECTRSGNDLRLLVIVNGEGVAFKAENANSSAGFGLASIKEQIHLIGGELGFWSDPLVGAQLEARAPLTKTSPDWP